jgi:hypothetical protein
MNGWKVTAIIFITLFIIETMFFFYLLKVGTDVISEEEECRINICEGTDSFYYDMYDRMCYCYEDDEIVREEYIR